MDNLESELDFSMCSNGTLVFRDGLCVPNHMDLKRWFLDEAHHTKYTVHPKSTEMYHKLKQGYQWNRMKKKIAQYVSKCQACQQMKAKHKKPAETLHSQVMKDSHVEMELHHHGLQRRTPQDSEWI